MNGGNQIGSSGFLGCRWLFNGPQFASVALREHIHVNLIEAVERAFLEGFLNQVASCSVVTTPDCKGDLLVELVGEVGSEGGGN